MRSFMDTVEVSPGERGHGRRDGASRPRAGRGLTAAEERVPRVHASALQRVGGAPSPRRVASRRGRRRDRSGSRARRISTRRRSFATRSNDAIESRPTHVDRRPHGRHVHRLDDARRPAERDPAGPAEQNTELRIVVDDPHVRRIFELTLLDHVMKLYPSVEVARLRAQAIEPQATEVTASSARVAATGMNRSSVAMSSTRLAGCDGATSTSRPPAVAHAAAARARASAAPKSRGTCTRRARSRRAPAVERRLELRARRRRSSTGRSRRRRGRRRRPSDVSVDRLSVGIVAQAESVVEDPVRPLGSPCARSAARPDRHTTRPHDRTRSSSPFLPASAGPASSPSCSAASARVSTFPSTGSTSSPSPPPRVAPSVEGDALELEADVLDDRLVVRIGPLESGTDDRCVAATRRRRARRQRRRASARTIRNGSSSRSSAARLDDDRGRPPSPHRPSGGLPHHRRPGRTRPAGRGDDAARPLARAPLRRSW